MSPCVPQASCNPETLQGRFCHLPREVKHLPRVTQSVWLEYKPAGSKASWVLPYKLLRKD